MLKLSRFGRKMTAHSGIVELMDDLGQALRVNPSMLFMGGGNPALIEPVADVFQHILQEIADDQATCRQMLGVYQSPQGDEACIQQLAALFQKEYSWDISPQNIAIANGSQSAFSVLFNMLAGEDEQGHLRRIQLPLTPEYLGYSDVGVQPDLFTAVRPSIELLPERQFKYRVNFDELTVDGSTAALCVSRPTNPTGNVITDDELQQLDQLAQAAGVPLIIDGAYGTPFPNIVFTDIVPFWNDNTILVLSLSKLGLPGVRTGIVVASEETIRAFSQINTIMSLACGTLGPAIAQKLMASNQLLPLSREYIQPFYADKMRYCLRRLHELFGDTPYRVHKPEGAIFIWLWFEGLPISSQVLYERLKQQGVLVIAGHHFFPGLQEPWQHTQECIRLNYTQSADVVDAGLRALVAEVKKAYSEST